MHLDHPVNGYRAVLGDGVQLIDVREPDEVAAGTLPGVTNIPLVELETRSAELDSSRRVVVLCSSGGRSTQAVTYLISIGFTDVINLEGGMLAVTSSNEGAEPS